MIHLIELRETRNLHLGRQTNWVRASTQTFPNPSLLKLVGRLPSQYISDAKYMINWATTLPKIFLLSTYWNIQYSLFLTSSNKCTPNMVVTESFLGAASQSYSFYKSTFVQMEFSVGWSELLHYLQTCNDDFQSEGKIAAPHSKTAISQITKCFHHCEDLQIKSPGIWGERPPVHWPSKKHAWCIRLYTYEGKFTFPESESPELALPKVDILMTGDPTQQSHHQID